MKPPTRSSFGEGLECTVSRIGNDYRNQCTETGFCEADLDRIAEMGIKTLRFPVLLETIAPQSFDDADWSWHDRHLGRLRELGIRVIATLCHHGSGPTYTDLLDPGFADILSRHARRVAERYPWIEDFTPVNEPLTTARFNCLYGHWYPHRKDNAAFLRGLVNQCKAMILCMAEIHKLNANRPADPDRRPRPRLFDGIAGLAGALREQSPLVEFRSVMRPRR